MRIDLLALDCVLRTNGTCLGTLHEHSQELVVFGSQVLGTCDAADWDILAFGDGRTMRGAGLDLIWRRPSVRSSSAFLESELASHVAQYGVWLKGTGQWATSAVISNKTIRNKEQILRGRTAAFGKVWPFLSVESRNMVEVVLRRDVQRLALLREGHPVPPRPDLDACWREIDRATWHGRARFPGSSPS